MNKSLNEIGDCPFASTLVMPLVTIRDVGWVGLGWYPSGWIGHGLTLTHPSKSGGRFCWFTHGLTHEINYISKKVIKEKFVDRRCCCDTTDVIYYRVNIYWLVGWAKIDHGMWQVYITRLIFFSSLSPFFLSFSCRLKLISSLRLVYLLLSQPRSFYLFCAWYIYVIYTPAALLYTCIYTYTNTSSFH
jgi:hypothetical protein